MSSTRTKKLARSIQKANPGMKYTEALRQAKSAEDATTEILFDPTNREAVSVGTSIPPQNARTLDIIPDKKALPLRLSRWVPPHGAGETIHLLPTEQPQWELPGGFRHPEVSSVPLFGNLAVTGWPGSGKTSLLRKLAEQSIQQGWAVSSLSFYIEEYDGIDGAETHVSGERDQADAWAFIKTINLGNARQQRLVVIDRAEFLFTQPGAIHPSEIKIHPSEIKALEDLLKDPHTAVVIQMQNPSLMESALRPFEELLHYRLFLGPSEELERSQFFGFADAEGSLSFPVGKGVLASRALIQRIKSLNEFIQREGLGGAGTPGTVLRYGSREEAEEDGFVWYTPADGGVDVQISDTLARKARSLGVTLRRAQD